jgi:transketolase
LEINVFSPEYSESLSYSARHAILDMVFNSNASHVGSAFSVVDILAVLYSGGANIHLNNCNNPNRDIVILSKGHAAAALYAVLAIRGFIPRDWLKTYSQDGGVLGGHVTSSGVPGVELSTGSLGHGFPYGVGIALSRRNKNESGHIFVVISDGECDEGTTWESAMIANHNSLSNLTVIVDRNRIQSLAGTEETLALEPFANKWESFGWDVVEVDGHNHLDILNSIQPGSKPKCVIANTTKGKGVDFMENSVLWHYKSPTSQELKNARESLESKYK